VNARSGWAAPRPRSWAGGAVWMVSGATPGLSTGLVFPETTGGVAIYSGDTMIHVYKRATEPFSPWGALRAGGPNNIAHHVKARYLVLWNVEVVRSEGAWHYVFTFDARDTLELGVLAQAISGRNARYRDDMDWKKFLGKDWQLVDEHHVFQALKANPGPLPGEVLISDVKVRQAPFPLPA
jgi:hypothetical protein